MKKLFITFAFISALCLSCTKEANEPYDPTRTEYCDIKYKYSGTYTTTKNNLFIGTGSEIDSQKAQVIKNMQSMGYSNITINNCTSKKH